MAPEEGPPFEISTPWEDTRDVMKMTTRILEIKAMVMEILE
jgi:hypothetical protein